MEFKLIKIEEVEVYEPKNLEDLMAWIDLSEKEYGKGNIRIERVE